MSITKEIEIPVPWGVVAGKTYGEFFNPPVLCLHGFFLEIFQHSYPQHVKKIRTLCMANNALYIGTSVRGVTKEIEIPVPWGVVAGKTYGESFNPPVLCLHGWLDNCNTFDSLIPMLPKDKFYVFIDLPGHGKSTNIPAGFLYTSIDYIGVLGRISLHFGWLHFSLMGHSFGGYCSGAYAVIFPEKVDKLILLDSMGFMIEPPEDTLKILRRSLESCLKIENQRRAPPLFSYEEARNRLLKASTSLTEQFADVILERGTAQQEDGSFKFVRDVRVNFLSPSGMPLSTAVLFVSKIKAETMHVLAKDGLMTRFPPDYRKEAEKILKEGFTASMYHSGIIEVEGKHHVHLCKPENVIEHINAMLLRPLRHGLSSHSSISKL